MNPDKSLPLITWIERFPLNSGLVIIMIGATVVTLMTDDVTKALIPLAVGLLSAFVTSSRRRLAP